MLFSTMFPEVYCPEVCFAEPFKESLMLLALTPEQCALASDKSTSRCVAQPTDLASNLIASDSWTKQAAVLNVRGSGLAARIGAQAVRP